MKQAWSTEEPKSSIDGRSRTRNSARDVCAIRQKPVGNESTSSTLKVVSCCSMDYGSASGSMSGKERSGEGLRTTLDRSAIGGPSRWRLSSLRKFRTRGRFPKCGAVEEVGETRQRVWRILNVSFLRSIFLLRRFEKTGRITPTIGQDRLAQSEAKAF